MQSSKRPMKQWIKQNKVALIMLIPGAIGGYLYWRYIGCTTGSCPITSVWYTSSLYGVILGFVLGNLVDERRAKKQRANEESNHPLGETPRSNG